jgi:gas vesicle protein
MAKKGNHMAGKLVGGALAGAALAVAAGLFMTSKTGRKAQKNAKVAAGKFYRHMAPKVKKMRTVGEAQLKAYAARGVKEYAKAQKLSAAEEKMLMAEAKKAWTYAQKHLPKQAKRFVKAVSKKSKKRSR